MRSELILCAGLSAIPAGEAAAQYVTPLTHPKVDQVCYYTSTSATVASFCMSALGANLSAIGGTLAVTGLSGVYAPLASPALTGTPTAPTQAVGDNSTDIATDAFVKAQGYSTGYTLPAASAGALGGIFSFAAVSHQFLTALSTAGSLSAAQLGFSDLTGSALAAQLPTATALAAGIVIAPSCSGTSSAFTGISAGTLTCSTLTPPTPAPTASTLGGVFSSAAGANQFATGVSTAGSLTYAQPAFSNLFGSIAAAQIPTPTAGALGGVKSATAGANQFGTGIDTTGTPTFAQPAFSNISGTATVTQLPLAASSTWTPSITSVTPGDLVLSAVTATGTYDRSILASGCMLHISWSWTGVVTYTTATGNLKVTGLPYSRASDGQSDWMLPGALSVFTWPGSASMIMWEIGPNTNFMLLRGLKTASNPGVLAITAITSGSTLTLTGSGDYKSGGC